MDKPRERYKVERWAAAWIKAADLIDDPCFGLKVAEVWSPTDLRALGYAFLASSTLRTALGRLFRYVQVVNRAVSCEFMDDGENVALTAVTENPVYQPPFAPQEDSGASFIVSLCRIPQRNQFSAGLLRTVRFFQGLQALERSIPDCGSRGGGRVSALPSL